MLTNYSFVSLLPEFSSQNKTGIQLVQLTNWNLVPKLNSFWFIFFINRNKWSTNLFPWLILGQTPIRPTKEQKPSQAFSTGMVVVSQTI
jgi:hypothetical protein